MATTRKRCQVFIPDPSDYSREIECGQPYEGDVTVKLPAGKGNANVRVCAKHKGILNSRAAQLRVGQKVVK